MDATHLRSEDADPTPVDCLLLLVAYRSAEDVAGLLDTVPAAVGHLSWRAVVVNNDPTEDLSGALAAHPEATLVESGGNLGYAGGLNRGRAAAPPARWTVFLNPDLRLRPDSLARLAATAGDRDAAVPTIVDDDGRLQHSLRREPTLLGSLGDALLGARWQARPTALGETITRRATYEHPGDHDWATGAALLVPSTVVDRVGAWDERFFLYSEETDYCRRLRRSGSRIRFVPDAVVSHRGAGSGTSDALHALQEVNRVRYVRKWHGVGGAAPFAAVAVLHHLLRCRRPRSRAALRALLRASDRAALPGGPR